MLHTCRQMHSSLFVLIVKVCFVVGYRITLDAKVTRDSLFLRLSGCISTVGACSRNPSHCAIEKGYSLSR